ncbi:MAG: alkaline phosphatase family protein [Nanoarchaeota archaeon]|nr:alkaline phosphatase family protein [Nanoarchaeota archaeon]MBU1028273.1 alkaline phosphatase family protein [Nanoarchaeota archaeon]
MKIIMIDGFRPDYLKHAPYLDSLTKKYIWGELEMPPGHWGGMEIFFKGRSNKLSLFYRTGHSSLWWTKYLRFLDYFGNIGRFILDFLINLIRLIKKQELFRTGKIPLKKLHKFDFSIKRPLHYNLPISYEYIGEIDKISHKYGTKSKELIKTIKKIDKQISGRTFDIILSDHGMADIKKIINVPETENCFIDSDMARYWGNKKELEKIRKKLPLKFGKIINWSDKRFGELVFLAKTNVLILPNYWQSKKPVKAMHGYDGKSKEMEAFYIINQKGFKKNLKVQELHKIFTKMLKNGG